MKAKARKKTSKPGVQNFCESTIQTIVRGQDVDDETVEAAIVFTHLVLGINPYVNPTATLGFMIELLSTGMDDQTAIEYGQMIARTASISGSQDGAENMQ